MVGAGGYRGNIHLVLALGREEPCCKRHGDDYHEADDDTPPARLGVSQETTGLWCGRLSRTRWPFLRTMMRDDSAAAVDLGGRGVVECETVCWQPREAALFVRWLVARRWRLAEAHAAAQGKLRFLAAALSHPTVIQVRLPPLHLTPYDITTATFQSSEFQQQAKV